MIKIKIGFIGAGKVGFSLGKYFSIKGLTVDGYYSRDFNSAAEAANFTNSNAYENVEDLIKSVDILFITVTDNQIVNVFKSLVKYDLSNKIICHASGSLSSQIFKFQDFYGTHFYSIHPIYPFNDKFNSYKNLESVYFSVEGDSEKLDLMKNLIKQLGNNTIVLDFDSKAKYHLACVMVANLTLSLLQIGTSYFQSFGLDEKSSFEALWPLISDNISNIKNLGFEKSITGPVARGDSGTVLKHLEVMDENHKDIYKDLSKNIIKICKNNLDNKSLKELKDILED